MKNEKIPYSDRLDLERAGKLPFFATQAGKTLSALLMLVFVIAVVALQLGKDNSIAYEMDKTQLAVACKNSGPLFVPYDTILSVELVETFELGQPVEASDWDSGWCGTYENEAYGTYTLYAFSSTGKYIVVRHAGGVLVFNAKTQKATSSVYDKLLQRIS